jgi:hypothetical protein
MVEDQAHITRRNIPDGIASFVQAIIPPKIPGMKLAEA